MNYKITIGKFWLSMLDSVTINKSVEQLSDTASIVLPGSHINKTIEIESQIARGDRVEIWLGYNDKLVLEFSGYLNEIVTENGSITLECEDEIYQFKKALKDRELKEATPQTLLKSVVDEINELNGEKGSSCACGFSCSFDFKWDKFVIYHFTGLDVLKKIQEETKANIYFKNNILHVHPQYQEVFNEKAVIYDFAFNVEKSSLKYKSADKSEYEVEVTAVAPDGTQKTFTTGTPGGNKRSLHISSSDKESMQARAEEELNLVAYSGYEGDFTGWLTPYCEPGYKAELKDADYPKKDGVYYIIATKTSFSKSGGERSITLGRKLQ